MSLSFADSLPPAVLDGRVHAWQSAVGHRCQQQGAQDRFGRRRPILVLREVPPGLDQEAVLDDAPVTAHAAGELIQRAAGQLHLFRPFRFPRRAGKHHRRPFRRDAAAVSRK